MLHATYIAGAEVYPSDMMQRDQDFIAPGVIATDDLVIAPTSVPSMAVTVSGATQGSPGGNAWLPGGYRVYNDTQVMLPIAAADGTNPRLDLVIATIDTTSTPYSASLQVIMGAPAASPTAPSIPVGLVALTLAQVEVPAGVTSIVAGNITDKRVISGLQGDGSRLRNIPSSAVPVATNTTAGIVKSSSSILVAGDGTLSATPASIGADPAGAAASAQSAAEAYSDTALAAHQADTVYQLAGGTATAITLTIKETLVNGFPMTFIASAANNGAATTINGKPLYKPGTTTTPNLIAGKAYTVWYNQAGNCFFIKASAEGNATVDQVLAGATFSNDSDTGLVGTRPPVARYTANTLYDTGLTVQANTYPRYAVSSSTGYLGGNASVDIVDLESKTLLASATTAISNNGTADEHDDYYYFVGSGGYAYCVDRNLNTIWQSTISGLVGGYLVTTKDYVICMIKGTAYKLDRLTGALLATTSHANLSYSYTSVWGISDDQTKAIFLTGSSSYAIVVIFNLADFTIEYTSSTLVGLQESSSINAYGVAIHGDYLYIIGFSSSNYYVYVTVYSYVNGVLGSSPLISMSNCVANSPMNANLMNWVKPYPSGVSLILNHQINTIKYDPDSKCLTQDVLIPISTAGGTQLGRNASKYVGVSGSTMDKYGYITQG